MIQRFCDVDWIWATPLQRRCVLVTPGQAGARPYKMPHADVMCNQKVILAQGGTYHSDHRHCIYGITKGNSCDRCDLDSPKCAAYVDNLPIDATALPIVENAKVLHTAVGAKTIRSGRINIGVVCLSNPQNRLGLDE